MTGGSNSLSPADAHWYGRSKLAIAEAVADGARVVAARTVYEREPSYPEDPKLRQRVHAMLFAELRDRGLVANGGASMRPRSTRHHGLETDWIVLRDFDAEVVRAEALATIARSEVSSSSPAQRDLPWSEEGVA